MKHTFAQLTARIAMLQQEANDALVREVMGDIRKVRALIAIYGPGTEDIFRTGKVAARGFKSGPMPQFADGNGNSWVGHGPRPHWLRDALSRGKSINEFRTQ